MALGVSALGASSFSPHLVIAAGQRRLADWRKIGVQATLVKK